MRYRLSLSALSSASSETCDLFGVLLLPGLLPLFPLLLLLAASGVVVELLWVATCEIASIKTTTSTSRTVHVLTAPRVDNDLTCDGGREGEKLKKHENFSALL